MTAAERADFMAREAIREARFEAFVRRQLDAQQEQDRLSRWICERAERERKRQLVLEFQI